MTAVLAAFWLVESDRGLVADAVVSLPHLVEDGTLPQEARGMYTLSFALGLLLLNPLFWALVQPRVGAGGYLTAQFMAGIGAYGLALLIMVPAGARSVPEDAQLIAGLSALLAGYPVVLVAWVAKRRRWDPSEQARRQPFKRFGTLALIALSGGAPGAAICDVLAAKRRGWRSEEEVRRTPFERLGTFALNFGCIGTLVLGAVVVAAL